MAENLQSTYINQFDKSAIIGELDLKSNPQPYIFTVRYNPEDTVTNTIQPAEGVKLTDLGGNEVNATGLPLVTKRTATSDPVYGVKLFNIKKNASSPNDIFDVAGNGAVMFMRAGEAVTRGMAIGLDLSNPGQVISSGDGIATVGFSLDHGAENDIIRVQIQTNMFLSSST